MEQLSMNQAPIQRRLKDLLDQNIIAIVNPEKWKLGKKKIHVLTELGRKVVNNIIDIEYIIKDVHYQISQIPGKLGSIRTWSRSSKLIDKSYTIEIYIRIKRQ